MLEELKRLQTHIANFKTRVQQLEKETLSLQQLKTAAEKSHHEKIQQHELATQEKNEQISSLKTSLSTLETQHTTLNQDAKTLAERYSRLEKGCTDLKSRFQEILAERNELRVTKEKLQHEQLAAQQEIKALKDERAILIKKNEHAKSKVETIVQRLAQLGTSEDQHAEEIQQLMHKTDLEEESSS